MYVGQTATFTVGASGTPPLSYQWNFDGTNMVGATNALLTLVNVQLSQAGTYAVLVTNLYGSTNSASALLMVNPPLPCDPEPTGLVAWWPGEGNANDIIGTNNGTPVGALGYTNGEVGQAFVFDGSTSYIPLPASPSLNLGTGSGITIECWIKPASANTQGPMVEWDSASTDGTEFWVQPGLELFTNVKDTSGNGHTMTSPGGILSTNSFQHVALTYDKGSGLAVIYLNGAMVISNNWGSFTPQTTYPLNIGRRLGQPIGLGQTYGGLLDELSLYNRALSQSEIQAIYNAGSGGKCPPTPAPPAITTQPTNQTVVVGGTATFSVTASGTLPLSYQWNFDGTNISGATNTSLVLTNVQLSQAGTYAVLVTNHYGSTNSASALLTVNSLQPCDPPPSGIVAWWPGEGNANDIIGTNNGTPVGALGYTNGEVGRAFVFDGSTSYIPLPASPSLNLGTGSGITIECWIKPASANTQGPMVEWDSASTDGTEFWVQPGLELFTNVKDTSGNGHTMTSPGGILSTNSFQHVALTYDKGSGLAVIYLNGAMVISNNWGSFTPQTTYPLNIGRRLGQPIGLGQTYGGLLDELSLYNRALSQSEIQAIYNAGSGGKCPPTPAPPAITHAADESAGHSGWHGDIQCDGQWHVAIELPVEFRRDEHGRSDEYDLLTLVNVQLSQAGTYAVLVTNLYGSTNSASALLTVNPLQPCDPPPSGIVAWWPGEGNANDIIGTNNGTPVGALGYTNGEVGRAFVFDGSTSYIPLPASPSLNLGTGSGITIECWIKPASANTLGPWWSGTQRARTVRNFGFNLRLELFTNVKDTSGNGHTMTSPGGILSTNSFQHVALTYDKGSGLAVIYLNGAMVISNNWGSFTPQTTYPLNIGRRLGQPIGLGQTYGGLLDEPSLYNRALSRTKYAAIYNAGSGGKCPPTPLRLRLSRSRRIRQWCSGWHGDIQRDGQWHAAIELPVEIRRDEHQWGDEYLAGAGQCAVESGGHLCGAGDQPLRFHEQRQRAADGQSATTTSAGHHRV